MKSASFSNKAASAAVSAVPASLYAVVLTATSDTATATLYDNATAGTGTVICSLSAATLTSAVFQPGVRIPTANGIYVTLTGTTPSCTVVYTP